MITVVTFFHSRSDYTMPKELRIGKSLLLSVITRTDFGSMYVLWKENRSRNKENIAIKIAYFGVWLFQIPV